MLPRSRPLFKKASPVWFLGVVLVRKVRRMRGNLIVTFRRPRGIDKADDVKFSPLVGKSRTEGENLSIRIDPWDEEVLFLSFVCASVGLSTPESCNAEYVEQRRMLSLSMFKVELDFWAVWELRITDHPGKWPKFRWSMTLNNRCSVLYGSLYGTVLRLYLINSENSLNVEIKMQAEIKDRMAVQHGCKW